MAMDSMHCEWCLILSHDVEDDNKSRAKLIRLLRAAGLICIVCKSQSGREMHIYVRCPCERLEQEAERIGMQKELLNDGGIAPFTIEKRHLFYGSLGSSSFFTSSQLQLLIYNIMTSEHKTNGACLDLEKLRDDGVLVDLIPLHDRNMKERLQLEFLSRRLENKSRSVTMVRDYLGEDLAFYFAWFYHFVRYWAPLAVSGLLLQLFQLAIWNQQVPTDSAGQAARALYWLQAIFAVAFHTQLAAYTLSWSRREFELRTEWAVKDYTEEDVDLFKDVDVSRLLDLSSILLSPSSQFAEKSIDRLRYVRWLTAMSEFAVISLFLWVACICCILIRIARDAYVPQLSSSSAVVFALVEGGRVLLFEELGRRLLEHLKRYDACFQVKSARTHLQEMKAFYLRSINASLCLLYVALTTTFGDPRDFSWPARCWRNDCLLDLQLNVWALLFSQVVVLELLQAVGRRARRLNLSQLLASDDLFALMRKRRGKQGPPQPSGPRQRRNIVMSSRGQADEEVQLPKFAGVELGYHFLAVPLAIVLCFGMTAPASLAVLILILAVKFQLDLRFLLHKAQRPVAKRSRGLRSFATFLLAVTVISNLLIPTVLIFVSNRSVSETVLGKPSCPVQFVCFLDHGVLRYNSSLPQYRWAVHPSDSNKHWLTWTALVSFALLLHVAWSVELRNPSCRMRALANEQQSKQLMMGMLLPVFDSQQQAINFEVFHQAYELEVRRSERRRTEEGWDEVDEWSELVREEGG
mmetsp:Transcript_41247/g.129583  ORF Transcript_41247/g.129583 Transcript_41247/m.129583 type:complete len:749 (+) Transcript_41247:1546-3792(+)